MSKIYKPHINGKPKRPGTHWYHYLGPTVAVVAGKPDLNFGHFRFRCNFQTVRNLQKGTTKMSSRGLKLVERSYGVAGNGRKMAGKVKNSPVITVAAAAAASPARSRRVLRLLAMKFGRRDRPEVAHLPVWRV